MKIGSPKQTYQPIGHCIYCGERRNQLGDEHIIALGLGGNFILPKSSCLSCGNRTGFVEQECLRKMFLHLRTYFQFPTRRPKQRPHELTLRGFDSAGKFDTRVVPIDHYPFALTMYALDTPGILLNQLPKETFNARGWNLTDENKFKDASEKYNLPVLAYNPFNLFIFSRMLAKIAHSYAVAIEGETSFVPLLQKLILEGSPTPSYWVGGDHEIHPPENYIHKLSTEVVTLTKFDGVISLTQYLVVKIRLFGFLGAPQYEVVVGKWKSS